MRLTTVAKIMMVLSMLFLWGCGSGGNGTSGVATIAKNVSLSATNPGVKGIDFTLILPDGVTVAANADGSLATGVVTIPANSSNAGKSSVQFGKYTPASASGKGTVRIVIVLNNPQSDSFVNDDNFFTIACTVAAGQPVPAASAYDYVLSVFDADGAPISGATASITT
jgi:hypothetical protein